MKSAERIKKTGEVFTPRTLIHEMLRTFPKEIWFDPNKRWFEPSAGDGNFLVEVKARLMQANHDEKHILDHMLFSVELFDDNHWVLQSRLNYLKNNKPNTDIWSEEEIKRKFLIGNTHHLAAHVDRHPYQEIMKLPEGKVCFHRNHLCTTALEVSETSFIFESHNAPQRPIFSLGAWKKTDTPNVDQISIVDQMLG